MVLTKEEAQRKVLEEMMKRMGPEKFMDNMTKAIEENIQVMKEILDENIDWGYKIIITEKGNYLLTRRQ
jgi:hypothetical protein